MPGGSSHRAHLEDVDVDEIPERFYYENFTAIVDALREIDSVFVTANDIGEYAGPEADGDFNRRLGELKNANILEEFTGSPTKYLNGYQEDGNWHLYPDSYWDRVDEILSNSLEHREE